MDASQLRRIESELALTLPASYQAALVSPPFDSALHGDVYWLYDDPERIISATLALRDGEYPGASWQAAFVAIGHSASSDLYLLDTSQLSAPILLLSHEDHSILEEFPTLDAYLAYWREETKDAAQQNEAARRVRTRTQREASIALAVIALSILFILVMLVVALLRRGG